MESKNSFIIPFCTSLAIIEMNLKIKCYYIIPLHNFVNNQIISREVGVDRTEVKQSLNLFYVNT